MGVREYVKSEFEKVEQEILLPHKQLFPSSITLEDFLWAFGILRSRAFSRLRGQNLILIPLADLVRLFVLSNRWMALAGKFLILDGVVERLAD